MKVLVQKNLLALGARQSAQRIESRVDELFWEGLARALPVFAEVRLPPCRLFGQAAERWCGRALPQSREQAREDVERDVLAAAGERGAREASLDQERPEVGVALQQPDRSIAVPQGERKVLVLALAVGEGDLEHDV